MTEIIYPNTPAVVNVEIDDHDMMPFITLKSVAVFKDNEKIETLTPTKSESKWMTTILFDKSKEEGDYDVIWDFNINGEPWTVKDTFTFKKEVQQKTSLNKLFNPAHTITSKNTEGVTSVSVKKYYRDAPIVLYGNIPKHTVLDAAVIIQRPNGERYATLVPEIKTLGDFGKWYVVTLNLNFTDEEGLWFVKWVFKTDRGDKEYGYNIHIVTYDLEIQTWCFQPIIEEQEDDTIPEDIKMSLNRDDL